MKAYSGTSSGGFSSALLVSNGTAAAATAPEPQDPAATFSDVLDQQEGGSTTPWPASAAATLVDPLTPFTVAPIALVVHSDPAPATPAATTSLAPPPALTSFFVPIAPTARIVSASASVSTDLATDPTATPALPAQTSNDAADQIILPRYVWSAQSQTSATTATSASLPHANRSSGNAAPFLPTFTTPTTTKPTVSTSATTSTPSDTTSPDTDESSRLTLNQYLLFAQQPKPATPPPIAPATGTAASDLESDEAASQESATTQFQLPAFTGTTQFTSTSIVPATPKNRAVIPTKAESASDATSAAIIASVLNPGGAKPAVSQAVVANANPALPQPQPTNETTPAATPANKPAFPMTPLATSMAHVAVLAATRQDSSAKSSPTPAETTPSASEETLDASAESAPTLSTQLNWVSKAGTAASAVEKKSAGGTAERSSVPSKKESASTSDMTSSLLQAALEASSNFSINQPVARTDATPIKAANTLTTAPISSAGTTNDKSSLNMASTLDMQNLVVSNGTHPLVTRADADLHIQLGTNADFHHALDQVMHVADLSNLSRVTPPLRVAIEIQTPPGAVVNVYISRQSDSSYRAQLSTNDAQALGWVQQQIGSLKETSDAGTAIRWSPVQLDSGTTATAGAGSSGSDRDLNWDRGGQQQSHSGYHDERDSRRQPAYVDADEAESLGFFDAIGAMGGAA